MRETCDAIPRLPKWQQIKQIAQLPKARQHFVSAFAQRTLHGHHRMQVTQGRQSCNDLCKLHGAQASALVSF